MQLCIAQIYNILLQYYKSIAKIASYFIKTLENYNINKFFNLFGQNINIDKQFSLFISYL